ncbi:MAG: phosphoglycerate kinase [Anaerovoracaceae bacterium]
MSGAADDTVPYRENAAVILMPLGRPGGQPDAQYTLKPVATRLSQLLGTDVIFAASTASWTMSKKSRTAQRRPGMLLENVRFQKEETKNGEEFAKELASLRYICQRRVRHCHRAHASTAGIISAGRISFSDRKGWSF